MADWSGGYVVDQDYIREYYEEYAPAHLDFAVAQCGVSPPAHDGSSFRYCDIGCGHGLVGTVVAAANPRAEIHNIDFMPGHVASGRRLAAETGLRNIAFHELSFEEACEADLPQFDYIVAHGIHSWVSREARAALVRFVGQQLAPGGVFYVSYNALPGRSMLEPLQRMLWERARITPGKSDDVAMQAVEFVRKLVEVEASSLTLNKFIMHKLDEIVDRPTRYLAHEYLNADWNPSYVTEVMEEMAAAKLSYAASAELLRNRPEWCLNGNQLALVHEQPTDAMRELTRDYCMNTAFRKDIYSRGGRRLSPVGRAAVLGERVIALRCAPEALSFEVELPGQTLQFDNEATRIVAARLAHGPATIATLAEEVGIEAAISTAEVLLISAQALPLMRTEAQPVPSFNAAVHRHAMGEVAIGVFASPYGAGLSAGLVDQVMAELGADGPDADTLSRRMLAAMEAIGRLPVRDGEALEGEAAVAHILPEAENFIANRAPALRGLGIMPPLPAGAASETVADGAPGRVPPA
ncbi:methyltransferase regulatory domain-containing protein [Paralimibaculum aggregatum]|uniref:Methyltransferase regulatory domain-containing protein n=1 Tax=Paralimibaculum aggregatum TaxID=3036245 RepID=A0ABQ6LIY6_9RHOB|nr:methyltransferase regulatory domain-containing protein [Limibaculum sp. NKW23]GMG83224.1 methyltransferase regulatory domain-containing protein [Limibaculum sp. NKW23]